MPKRTARDPARGALCVTKSLHALARPLCRTKAGLIYIRAGVDVCPSETSKKDCRSRRVEVARENLVYYSWCGGKPEKKWQ